MSFPSRRSSIKRRAASTVTDIDRVGRRCRRPRWVTSRDRCPSSIQKFCLSLPPRERDSNDFSFLSVMPPRSSSTFLPVPVIAHLLLPSPLRWGHLHATARVTCHVTRIEFDVVKCGPRWLLAKWEPCKGCILRRIVASFPFEPRRWCTFTFNSRLIFEIRGYRRRINACGNYSGTRICIGGTTEYVRNKW